MVYTVHNKTSMLKTYYIVNVTFTIYCKMVESHIVFLKHLHQVASF